MKSFRLIYFLPINPANSQTVINLLIWLTDPQLNIFITMYAAIKWGKGCFFLFVQGNAGLEFATITVIVIITMHVTSNETTSVLPYFLQGWGWKLQPIQFEMGLTILCSKELRIQLLYTLWKLKHPSPAV